MPNLAEQPTTLPKAISAHWRLWISLAATILLLALIANQFYQYPFIGLADNGDFGRTIGYFNLRHQGNGPAPIYFDYYDRVYVYGPPYFHPPFPTSQLIFLQLAVWLNRLSADPTHFDLRLLAGIYLIFLAGAVFLLVQYAARWGWKSQLMLAAFAIVVFSDVGYAAYLNSFYSEPVSFLGLIAAVTATLYLFDKQTTPRLVVAVALWTIFLCSKPQNVPLCIFVIPLFLRTARLQSSTSWLWRSFAAAAILLLASIVYYRATPQQNIVRPTYWVSVFYGILLNQPDPASDLQDLGLPAELAKYANTTPYDQGISLDSEELRVKFFERISFGKIAWYYTVHPLRLLRTLDRSAEYALTLRPNLGNFEFETGRPARSFAIANSWWSRYHRSVYPASIYSLSLWFLFATAAGLFVWRRSSALSSRMIAELYFCLLLMCASQFVLVALTQSIIDTAKHNFLVSVSFDLCVGMGVVWAFHWLVTVGIPNRGNVLVFARKAPTLLSRGWTLLQSPEPLPPGSNNLLVHLQRHGNLLSCLLVIAFAAAVFWNMIQYRTFGPEYSNFYMLQNGLTFKGLLDAYTKFHGSWYRPTAFLTPYFFGKFFISWHNTPGWKIAELCTCMASAFLIYTLVRMLKFPVIAATLAAVYFLANPTIFDGVYTVMAFDFTHVMFALLAVICFLKALQNRGRTGIVWTVLSFLSYLAALSSKEITITTPVYLACAGVVLLWPDRGRLVKLVIRVAPFFLITAAYWLAHFSYIPDAAFSKDKAYRKEANWSMIAENAVKYPFWMARIYGEVPDRSFQSAEYNKIQNNVCGVFFLAITVAGCYVLVRRDRRNFRALLLLLLFVGGFSVVPVFSGLLFHHGVLPMCGYAALFGIAAAELISAFRTIESRWAASGALIMILLALAMLDARSHIVNGLFHLQYRMNYYALNGTPSPQVDLRNGPALVFIDDRINLGDWSYGMGHLVRLMYLNPKLEQILVPADPAKHRGICMLWSTAPRAAHLSYDSQFRWKDTSAQFRTYCEGLLR